MWGSSQSLGGIMTVRFSCCCPNADYLGFEATPEGIIAWAAKAEELGFDAFFVNDHIIVDSSTRSGPWTNTYDPLVALSFIAANTTRIWLGISVLIVAGGSRIGNRGYFYPLTVP
jgi:hypothetical protein